jgi:hypothetical protein
MLVKQESLRKYFHEFLQNSLDSQNVKAQDHTISYLTNLLVSFSRTETFIDPGQGRATHKPLAIYYSKAVNSQNNHERNMALRRLGDIALFICGLFSDSLSKKAVDIDYYVAMGGSAYSCLSVSVCAPNTDAPIENVYDELSSKFIDFVDVLSELNENQKQSNKNLLRTYEIWLRTQSKRAKNILIENGIDPITHSPCIQ